jgi:hypothetical protein
MNMQNRLVLSGIALFTFVLVGCASTASKVRVDQAENVDFSKCQTFDWRPTSDQPASFTEQRVRTEVMAVLQAKGYTQSGDKPDCQITYVLSTQERPRSKPSVGVGAGGGSGGIGGGIGVTLPIGRRNEQAGTFTLDVIDAARKEQIWSGAVDGSFSSDALTEEEAKELVTRVLEEFPDRAGQNKR